jgi:hypothetical protein
LGNGIDDTNYSRATKADLVPIDHSGLETGATSTLPSKV